MELVEDYEEEVDTRSPWKCTVQCTDAANAASDDPGNVADRGWHPADSVARTNAGCHLRADKDCLETLLSRTASGDQAAFLELYRRTSRRVFAYLVRMVVERSEAEDLLQDTYTAAWKRAESFDCSRGSAMTWLITLARNRAIDSLRRSREYPLTDALMITIPDCAPAPEMRVEAHEIRTKLEEGLRRLSAQQHRAIKFAFYGGLTYNELANLLGVPPGTAKSWIRRGLAHLRVYLEA
ncbi:sigma-70 family RNA polymerase sigma factor [Paraburkholderia tropica]|uniref:RNA polymerase sigma factor n=1 Tax=Paraburkholderia tropica TaxID=92647 RepID=UPI0032B3E88C